MKKPIFKPGEKDHDGEEITRVYARCDNFIIYGTKFSPICYYFQPGDRREELICKSQEICIELCKIQSMQTGGLIHHKAINAEIARALRLCFEGNVKAAKTVLIETEKRLIKLRRLNGRIHYILSCMATLFITSAMLISIRFIMRASLTENAIVFIYAILCGSLGGFLSVSLSIKKLDVDPDAPWSINAISGASRILIAMIGSAFVYLLVKADIVFGIFSEYESLFSLLSISFTAGFSETYVPNILRKMESSQEPGTNKK